MAAEIGISRRALEGLGLLSALAAVLFAIAVAVTAPATGFWYLAWNLFLAYIPLALTFPLVRATAKRGWYSWQAALWGLVWLVWLPNSFYVLTDMVHLIDHNYGLEPLFGVVLFGLFAAIGMVCGFMCMVAVHREMRRQAGAAMAYVLAEVVLLVSSGAIYAGRTLRWNSWDAVLHPAAIARDVFSGLVAGNSLELWTTTLFFVLLSGLYAAIWHVFGEHE